MYLLGQLYVKYPSQKPSSIDVHAFHVEDRVQLPYVRYGVAALIKPNANVSGASYWSLQLGNLHRCFGDFEIPACASSFSLEYSKVNPSRRSVSSRAAHSMCLYYYCSYEFKEHHLCTSNQ